MKLLVLNQYASTPKYSTGAGERIYYLSEYLKKENFDLTVISAAYNHLFQKLPRAEKLFNKEVVNGIEYYWVKMRIYNPRSGFQRTFSLFEFLFKLFLFPLKKKPDLIIVSSMSILPVIYAVYLKLRFGVPYILEIRDIWPLTAIDLGGYSKKNIFIRFLDFVADMGYRNADHIIGVMPRLQDFLKEKKIKFKAVTHIPNGIEIFEETCVEKTLAESVEHCFTVGYAGAIGTANALNYLVEAAKILEKESAKIKFLLIGDGPELEKLKKNATHLTNINFLPKVPKGEVHKVLQSFDVCYIGWHNCKVYKYGVSANKYNDYMLAKKPIISSSEIIDDPVEIAKCGIRVPAEDPVSIAKAVIQLFNTDKNDLAKLGLNGYNYLLENQTYNILAKKYISVINQVKQL